MKRKNRMKVALRRTVGRAFVAAPLVFLTVAGAGCPSLFESNTQRAAHVRQAVAGKDSAHTVAGAETVNLYAPLAGAADPVAGATTITVTDAAFLAGVAQGDLLLIIQMAGATINTSSNDATYGSIVSLGNAGRYEFVGVEGRTGNVITLACGLRNGYSLAGKTQVIRVPQYTTLTIPAGTSITAPPWNGTIGGVVAVHAETTLDLSGAINVTATGFRGGQAENLSQLPPGTTAYLSDSPNAGAEKGEGIGGYEADLGTTFYGRGAAANGGGGGDAHNAGGGGGANAGSIDGWNGQGVMEQCAAGQSWRAAWLLDPASNGTTCTTSQGGGRGGYSYSWAASSPNPLTTGPDNIAWGGDNRRQVGGLGGRPVPNNVSNTLASRLFLGGGGGAGDGNNNAAGRGGRGGGLVFVIARAVTGSGTISANGEAGGNASFTALGGDGPGGGGGGGTVVVHAASIASTVGVVANGGHGGNQVGSSNDNEVEGPGGGGGGGYVAVLGGTPAMTATGGPAGTTDRTTMASFPVDGATAGGPGITSGDATSFLYCATSAALLTTIATHPPAFSNLATGSFTFTNTQSPVTYECKIDTAAWVPCNASYTTPTLDDGEHTISVRATNVAGAVETPAVTFTWTIDTVRPVTTIATHPANPSPSPIGTFTFTNTESPVTYECKLDSGAWAACNSTTPSSPTYTTAPLGDGSHTLTVRATDQAGNVDETPPTFTWLIEAAALDAGSLDAGVDGGALLLDAEGLDQSADVGGGNDAATNKDVAGPDLPSDVVVVIPPDLAPLVRLDSGLDQGVGDLGTAVDSQTVDSQADGVNDVAAEAGDDAAVVTNRDALAPNGDDAPVIKKDAAPVALDDLKVMGSGFCAIAAPERRAAPALFVVVGLVFGGLIARRRRR